MPQVSEEEAYILQLRIRIASLEDEIAMVRKGNQVLHNNKEHYRNEYERLRNALEQIAECSEFDDYTKIARKALSE